MNAAFAALCVGVDDPLVLSAIGCHTTLRAHPSELDKIVFIADKLAWDQSGEPPYLSAVVPARTTSLDAGVRAYLSSLWQRRDRLVVVHPWFVDAYRQYENE